MATYSRADRASLGPVQLERAGVDAVALAGGLGAVVEHVAQVRTARGAGRLDAVHEVAEVVVELHGVRRGRIPEARPSRPRLELRVGAEQLRPARPASVHALGVLVPVGARERGLGSLLPEHLVLLRRQLLAPFLLRLLDPGRHHRLLRLSGFTPFNTPNVLGVPPRDAVGERGLSLTPGARSKPTLPWASRSATEGRRRGPRRWRSPPTGPGRRSPLARRRCRGRPAAPRR